MGNIKVFLLLAAVLVPTLLAVNVEGQQGNVAVDKYSNGENVTLAVGQYLEVRLQESGSTGYTWQVEGLDSNLLECIDSGSAPTQKPSRKVGSPVLKTWRFKALAKGNTELKMLNYRSWEGPDNAEDSFQVRVTIR